MTKHYRALISVPISATSDDDAIRQGVDHAHSLLHPGGKIVAGHLEFVGEVQEGSAMEIVRVVDQDPLFARQLPPELKTS